MKKYITCLVFIIVCFLVSDVDAAGTIKNPFALHPKHRQKLTNSILDITNDFSQGSVIFGGVSTLTEDNVNLFWDDTNKRLGIGTLNPSVLLSLNEVDDVSVFRLDGARTIGGNNAIMEIYNSSVLRTRLRASGIQDWFLNSGAVEAGAISYTTPAGDPAIAIFGVDSDDRAHIRLDGSTLTLGASTSGGSPQQVFITDAGNVGIGTPLPTEKLDINSDSIRLRIPQTPVNPTSMGDQGQITWDSGYIYVCILTNTWVRTALSTWTAVVFNIVLDDGTSKILLDDGASALIGR